MALTDKLTAIGNAIRAKNGTSGTYTLAQMPAAISELSGAVNDTQTYNQVNAKVAEYLANVTYDPSDYTTSQVGAYSTASTSYRKDRPAGVTVPVPASSTVFVYDGKGSGSQPASSDLTVNNLTPGGTASYIAQNSSDEIISTGLLKPTGALRMIDGGSTTYNIRDLGGWACDGGTIKYGKIFRGCELNGENGVVLSDVQKKIFTGFLNILDEIDLRDDPDVDGDDGIYGTGDDITVSALGDGVGYIRRAINPYAANNDIQKQRYTDAINRIIDDVVKDHACYVHCVAGADRTGTICALIEGLCGVSQSDIDKDYELTSFSGDGRLRNNSYYSGFIGDITALPGTTFRDKVVAYVLQVGVYIEKINALRNALIDGNPGAVTSPFAPVAVTNTLSNVTTSNNAATVGLYDSYTATLTPAANYNITSVTVTMGGTDITSSVYSNGVISIPRVTGAVAVSATAIAGYTNLIPTAQVKGGGAVYNGVGYQDGYYISGDMDRTDANYTAVGFISYPVPSTGLPPTIYIKGTTWSGTDHTRLGLYGSNYGYDTTRSSTLGSGIKHFNKTDLGDNYFKLEPKASGNTSEIYAGNSDISYIRFSFQCSGANLIIAFEPIS